MCRRASSIGITRLKLPTPAPTGFRIEYAGGARTISPRSGSPDAPSTSATSASRWSHGCGRSKPQTLATTEVRPSAATTSGAENRSAAVVAPLEADRLGDDAGDARALPEEVDHAHPLADGDADLPGTLDERRVEDPAAHGEGVRPIAGPRAVGRVVSDEQRAVGREDAHAPERPGSVRLHPGEDAEAIQDPATLRREVLAADLVAGEPGPVEEDDRQPLPARGGSPSRRRPAPRRRPPRQPARAAPSDPRVQTPTWRNAGARCQRRSGNPARSARRVSSAGVYARRTESGPSWRACDRTPSRASRATPRPRRAAPGGSR